MQKSDQYKLVHFVVKQEITATELEKEYIKALDYLLEYVHYKKKNIDSQFVHKSNLASIVQKISTLNIKDTEFANTIACFVQLVNQYNDFISKYTSIQYKNKLIN